MIRTYYMLTKPGIILGNLITTAGGFALASRGHIDFSLFLATLVGLGLVIASACVFNNAIDRHADKKMERTKNRALASGLVSLTAALTFAILLGVIGTIVLALYTNPIAVATAITGFFFYVVMYSIWKYRSSAGTLIGSISGAIPPVVGYCTVSHRFDAGAAILFTILVLWQMPHFYSIAVFRFKDYAAASIPVLPIVRGMDFTKKTMLAYIIAFIASTTLLLAFNYTGYTYLLVATLLGLAWLALCIRGFKAANDVVWARQMFRLSLLIITVLSVMISVDTV